MKFSIIRNFLFCLISIIFFFLCTCLPIARFALFSQVIINEYSCANINGPNDNYGNNEDWIELYNTGGTSVNLAGYFLSDKAGNPAKWQIPSGTIAAGGFMVFWASGRDTVVGTNRHTNFKLTQTKPEKLILTNNLGAIIDSLTLKPTLKDNSRGRTTNGAATWSVFTTVTNGTSNNNPQQEYATKPSMNLAPGFYSGTQTVTITTPDANVTIRYTTNGVSPTSSSTIYVGPITISATTILRAKAFSSVSTIPPSFVESNTYFINSPHTIPVVSVFGGSLMSLMNGTQGNPETGLEYFNAAGTFKTESYGTSNKHGNDSWSYDQRGIDFVSYDQYGYNYALQEKFFDNKPRTEFQRVILKASAGDNYPFETDGSSQQWGAGAPLEGACHIRDQYVHTLSQRGGLNLDERTWAPCIVYVNGQYWGVYDLREKVDDNDFLDYYYDQFEKYNGSTQYVQFLKTWGGTWSEFGGAQAQTDWDNLVTFITSNNMTIPANFAYVDSVYNWKSLIDYFVLNSYVVTSDWLNWNTAWWHGLEPNGDKKKWRYVLWDMDATFGHYVNYTGVPDQNPTADPCNPEGLGDPGGQGHVPILNALMPNQTFYQYYVSRYIDLSNTVFQCSYMNALLDSMIAVIQPEMQAQINKWAPAAGTGSMNDWLGNVQELKDFINQRCAATSTGMTDCYQVTGPYNLTVDVVPAGTGTVTVNSITPTTYAYNGQYYGNINIMLNANANTGYVFDYWESTSGDTINPDTLNPSAFFNIEGTDTMIAHFKPNNLVDLTVLVSPNLSGKVNLNGTLINNYPFDSSYTAGTAFGIIAIPEPGFVFSHWTLNNNTILPDTLSDTATFTLNASDTLTAFFDSVPQTLVNLTVDVSPAGSGKVNLSGTLINNYPFNSSYPPGTNFGIIAVPNPGFSFAYWTLNNNVILPNTLSDSAVFTLNFSDTLIAYFDSVPPTLYNLHVKVSPSGSGNVNLNGMLLSTPFDGIYSPGSLLNIIAIPTIGYNFIQWTLNNDTINPNDFSDTANFTIDGNDTLTAYFDTIPQSLVNLTVLVSPNGSGKVNLSGTLIPAYPYNNSYATGTNFGIIAVPNPGFSFAYWALNNNLISPDSLADTAAFTLNFSDTLIAYFDSIPTTLNNLTVIVSPPGTGNVKLNGTLLSPIPFNGTYNSGTLMNIIGIPITGYNFVQWTLNNHIINPNGLSDTANFTITSSDTLIAYFDSVPPTLYNLTVIVTPPNSGNVNLDGTLLSSYPYNTTYISGTNLNIVAIANGGFAFNSWLMFNNSVNPNNTSINASFTINSSDTLFAFFDSVPPPVLHQLTIMVSPASSGNVDLDGTILSAYPYNTMYPEGSDIGLDALPATNYEFDYWTVLHHTLSPDVNSANVSLLNFLVDDTVTAYFKEIPDTGYKGIYVPTGFSPNGDNNNDVLFVFAGKDVTSFQLNVYDRWGNLVFQTSEKTKGWDGTFKGKKADIGVYAYQLRATLKDGSEQTKGGDITLVR